MNGAPSLLQRLLREPLVHFLLLGGGLFLVFALTRSPGSAERDIVVTPGRVEQIAESFQRVWNRPPTRAELNGLIDDFVLEEVYYREALALGLEEDDTIIRRRLRQKMEFVAEGVGEALEPTEAELQAFLDENTERFRVDFKITMEQVYVSVDRRGKGSMADAERLKRQLEAAGSGVDPSRYGDPFLLPSHFDSVESGELDRMFGQGFGESVRALEPGSWQGPIESGYGLHLVLVRRVEAGRLPGLDEIRDEVRTEWETARREELEADYEKRLLEGYKVTVQWPEWAREAASAP